MMGRGRINGWRCKACGEITYAVHVHEGVTPMFLACRARGLDPEENPCAGMGVSLMYPEAEVPPHVKREVRWEWYMPEGAERRALRGQVAEHVEMGGLLLRKLTLAGNEAMR